MLNSYQIIELEEKNESHQNRRIKPSSVQNRRRKSKKR